MLLVFDPRPGTGRIPGAFQAEIPLSSLGYGGVSGLGREINLLSFTPTLSCCWARGCGSDRMGRASAASAALGTTQSPRMCQGKCQPCSCIPALPPQPWEQPGPRIPHSQPIPALLEAAPGSMEGIKGGLGASPGLERGMIPGNRCRWSREIHSAEPQAGAVVGPHPFPSTGTPQGRALQPGSPALLNSSRPRDTKGFHLNSGQR